MTTFTIDEQNNITAFGSADEAAAATATPVDSFSTQNPAGFLDRSPVSIAFPVPPAVQGRPTLFSNASKRVSERRLSKAGSTFK